MKIECTKQEYEDMVVVIGEGFEQIMELTDKCFFAASDEDEPDCEKYDFDCTDCARQRIEWVITDKPNRSVLNKE